MESLPFQPLLDWVGQNPHLSGAVVFAIAAAESLVVVGILVPGVAMMLGIGTLVGLDALPLWPTLFWAAAGAAVGDGAGYWLGHHYDKQLRHLWPMTRYPELIPKGERFFQRHGGISVLFGRFVGPVRSIIPAVAGMMHMPPTRFYLVNILSAMAWAPVVILPGVAFGASLSLASEVALRFAELLGGAILLLWFIGWLLKRLLGRFIARGVLRAYLIFNTLLRMYPQRLIAGASVVTLVSVLVLSAAMWYRPGTAPEYDFSEQQWWGKDWQALPAYRDNNARSPLQLQWHGELTSIRSLLRDSGWQVPETLKLKNAMRWLTPDPVPAQLPVLPKTLNGVDAALVMMHTEPHSSDALVLRLWRLTAEPKPKLMSKNVARQALWVGALDYLSAVELGAGFYIPREIAAGHQSLVALQQTLKARMSGLEVELVRRSHVPDIGLWHGEVLLLRTVVKDKVDEVG